MNVYLSDRIQKILFVLVVLLTVGFLMYPAYLPMADLPQHAAQVVALDGLLKHRSPWSDMVMLNWDTPYLTMYLVWLGLYQVFDITLSAKLMVCGLFLFYVCSIRLLNREFDDNPLLDWVALTCFFGFAFQWGFVGYMAGIPVGILFFIACKRWLDSGQCRYGIAVVVLGVASYFSHVLTFAFFSLVSYAYFLVESPRLSWRQRVVFTLLYLLFAVLLIRYLTIPNPVPFKYYPYDWLLHGPLEKTVNLFYMPWNMVWLFYYEAAIAAVFVAPLLLGYQLSREKKRYAPLAAALIVWYAMPSFAFQTAFLYERFALFIPVFYYLIWEKKAPVSGWRYSMAQLGSLFFIGAVAALMFKVYQNNVLFGHSAVVADFKAVMNEAAPAKRMLSILGRFDQGEGNLTSHNEMLHFGQWYQAEKNGWVDYSFASAHAMPVRLKNLYSGYGHNRSADELTLSEKLDCAYYDYLLTRSSQHSSSAIQQFLQSNPTCGMMFLKKQQGEWALFERRQVGL